MTTAMTSRERVLTTFAHQEPDRVPRWCGAQPEFWAKAKRELKLSLQDDPLQSQSHFLLALLLAREKNLDQAIVGFQQTVALEPNNAVARYNLGTALLRRGETLPAASLFE